MDKVFKDVNGVISAYIYKTDDGYEVWKRERIIGTPGNKHSYVAKYSDIVKATKAAKEL